MTIQEQNRIIAEFMGWQYRGIVRKGIFGLGKREEYFFRPIYKIQVWLSYFQYHTSWDFLMPVWIKFRNLNLDSKEYSEWCSGLGWYLYSSDEPSRFCERIAYAIQWYNTLKK